MNRHLNFTFDFSTILPHVTSFLMMCPSSMGEARVKSSLGQRCNYKVFLSCHSQRQVRHVG